MKICFSLCRDDLFVLTQYIIIKETSLVYYLERFFFICNISTDKYKKRHIVIKMMTLKEYKEQKFHYGTGCEPSVMDGTEHIYTYDEKAELPDEFSWRDSMPPVRN